MSHSIPVVFTIVDKSFPACSEWGEALEALAEIDPTITSDKDPKSLWQHTSRNWWHVYLLDDLRTAMELTGLGFIGEEVALVGGAALHATISSLDSIMRAFKHGTAPLPAIKDQWHANILARHPPRYDEIQPSRNSDDNGDTDEAISAASFHCFLVSLRAMASEASMGDKALLWVMPQP